MEFDLYHLSAIALGAFFVGFLKTTFNAAIGTLLLPVMVFFWPVRFVIGFIAVHMWTTDYAAIRFFWRRWEWRLVKLVVPGFLLGILLGTAFLVRLPDFWLRKGIGMTCLVFASLQAWSELRGGFKPPPIGAWTGVAIGLVGGIISALFHSGGLVLNLYLLSQGLSKVPLVATVIITWMWVNPVKITSYWVGGLLDAPLFFASAAMVPLTFLGGWVGSRLLRRIPQRAFNLILLALSALAAFRLLSA